MTTPLNPAVSLKDIFNAAEEISAYKWGEMRKELRKTVLDFELSIDRSRLARDLTEYVEESLVVPKATALAQYLKDFQASRSFKSYLKQR